MNNDISKWCSDVTAYLTAAADGSMSRNNSENLAAELLASITFIDNPIERSDIGKSEGIRMDYLKLLENSYEMEKISSDCPPETRLAFLSEYVFDITTYDGDMDDFFGRKAVEVCAAITNRTTFDFIKDKDNYQWFLIICNMPFFYPRLSWGTSIRGAQWDVGYDNGIRNTSYKINSCGIWDGDEQLTDLQFSEEEWTAFMLAIVEFAQVEITAHNAH